MARLRIRLFPGSVDRLEYVIGGVTNVTAFLGTRGPDNFLG